MIKLKILQVYTPFKSGTNVQDLKKREISLKTFEYLPFSKDSGMKRDSSFLKSYILLNFR
jgi:hypothetical protein